MKFMPSQLLYFFQHKTFKRNKLVLFKFLLVIAATITLYSMLFHYIMEYEGRSYSWITGFYWTLTVMSTLGFGDITFESDIGRVFSMFVLMSGIVFLLIMLPFTFIRFFYDPWLEAQEQSRTPRELPDTARNHVIMTNFEPIAMSLAQKLKQYGYDYVIAVDDLQIAGELHDMNYKVVLGDLDDPETYKKLRIDRAALVLVNNNDMLNTNIIATIREISESVPIVTSADSDDSIDILELAGATKVFQFTKILGTTMAQHALGVSTHTNIVGGFGDLLIAEAHAFRTPFEGKTLLESGLRQKTGINVVGIWQRGTFEIPGPHTTILSTSILMLAGSEEHFRRYDDLIGGSRTFTAPVVILGGGRVGHAAAGALAERGIEYCIVEKDGELIKSDEQSIVGDAADIHILERAGISQDAPSVFVTTHDDTVNIYLTIYCRQLRPNIQIISRATLDRNITKLYAAGADIVMSYASMGAHKILNFLKPNENLMLAEGLNVFKKPVPLALRHRPISEIEIREKIGCNIVAIQSGEKMLINPDPSIELGENDELILIGTTDAERKFIDAFS